MVQLRKNRTALSLYAVLVVLPTVVLGVLHWYQLRLDHIAGIEAVPRRADDAARRLVEAIHGRLGRVLDKENRRPFFHYGDLYAAEGADGEELALVSTPLVEEDLPEGISGWFEYKVEEGPARISVFAGALAGNTAAGTKSSGLAETVHSFIDATGGGMSSGIFASGTGRSIEAPLVTASVTRSQSEFHSCIRACLPLLRDATLPISYSDFRLRFFTSSEGAPHIVATRNVLMLKPPAELLEKAKCLGPLAKETRLVQGFVVDSDWLFSQLPRSLAAQVLSHSERFVPTEEAYIKFTGDEVQSSIWLVDELGLELINPDDEYYGQMKVAIDMGAMERQFRSQSVRFLGVAAMLGLSLLTGVGLLLRSVSLEIEQAKRTENFVAAVTHELRTPLSAIKLYGEMLLEGWAKDEAKQKLYYQRIVGETSRLSTLVERVLEKAKLGQKSAKPTPTELSEAVGRMQRELEHASTVPDDLKFELEPELPSVWMTHEALHGILINLVENARKYGPYRPGQPGSEPITIRTRRMEGRVVLEVADTGPGVPENERAHVFEAFYRVGSEATRTTKGTGLGLHLVQLHAESVHGKAEVLDNPGGGALFRVTLKGAA